MYRLQRLGIMPGKETFTYRSFRDIRRELSNAADEALCDIFPCEDDHCEACTWQQEETQEKTMRQHLMAEMDRIALAENGLCLDCVRTAQRSKAEGSCRISH